MRREISSLGETDYYINIIKALLRSDTVSIILYFTATRNPAHEIDDEIEMTVHNSDEQRNENIYLYFKH